jgi:hypothetical protein
VCNFTARVASLCKRADPLALLPLRPRSPLTIMAATSSIAAVAVVAVAASSSSNGVDEYPQFDGTSLGLPRDFILYGYNRLKG